MDFNPYLLLGGAVVGLLIGLTGAGGGSLMTPMLTILFGLRTPTAIASDLVATLFIRPVGALVHGRRGSVHPGIVRYAALGAVPGAIVGTFILHELGQTKSGEAVLQHALGAALLLGCLATVLRTLRQDRTAASVPASQVAVRPVPTALVGSVGGFLVGLTSVGAGSVLVVLLLFLYPSLQTRQIVGTDLLLAVPLTLAAAGGALIYGHVRLDVSFALVAGAVPGVVAGSLLAGVLPERLIRPAVTAVVFASGLKYAGADGRIVLASLLAGLLVAVLIGSRKPTRDPAD
jgi:uncharacterized membrane protein YfcA